MPTLSESMTKLIEKRFSISLGPLNKHLKTWKYL
jgi:hypothetical protein